MIFPDIAKKYTIAREAKFLSGPVKSLCSTESTRTATVLTISPLDITTSTTSMLSSSIQKLTIPQYLNRSFQSSKVHTSKLTFFYKN